MSAGSDYPRRVRELLEACRAEGRPWGLAWMLVRERIAVPEEWGTMGTFLERHMRAAYEREDTRDGRLRVARPDTMVLSGARPVVVVGERRCRSGDGCDRLATRGRFGATWCEAHGLELEGLRDVDGSARHFGAGRSARSAAA